MPIPRIYKEQACPLDGYDGLSVRLLVNPTGKELRDWQIGTLGTPGCEKCAALNQPKVVRGKGPPPPPADAERRYCEDCTALRAMKGRAAAVLFGPMLLERPCSTVDEALAILDDDDLPPELFIWLLLLPDKVVEERQDELIKNLRGSATIPSP